VVGLGPRFEGYFSINYRAVQGVTPREETVGVQRGQSQMDGRWILRGHQLSTNKTCLGGRVGGNTQVGRHTVAGQVTGKEVSSASSTAATQGEGEGRKEDNQRAMV